MVQRQRTVRERARVTPTTQTGLEAVFELFGDKVEDYGIDAGVYGCHIDAEVVQHQQEIQQLTAVCIMGFVDGFLQ